MSERNHNLWFYLSTTCFTRSPNAGVSWDSVVTFPVNFPISGLYEDQNCDSTLFYYGSYVFDAFEDWYGGVMRSRDLGDTWEPIVDFYDLFGFEFVAVTDFLRMSNNELMAVAFLRDPEGGEPLFVSSDEGETWTIIGDNIPRFYQANTIHEDSGIPGRLYLTGLSRKGVLVSNDYGRTWERIRNGLPENVCNPAYIDQNAFSGRLFVPVNGYGAFISDDHGESWQPVPTPPIGNGTASLLYDPESVFLSDNSYRMYELDTDPGDWNEILWQTEPDSITQLEPVFYHVGDTLVTLGNRYSWETEEGYNFFARSYDPGQTWDFSSAPGEMTGAFRTFITDSLYRCVTYSEGNDTIFVTTDGGNNWVVTQLPDGQKRRGNIVQNDSVIYLMSRSDILFSRDDGVTWDSLDFEHDLDGFRSPIAIYENNLYLKSEGYCWSWINGEWEQRGGIHPEITYMISFPLDGNPVLMASSLYHSSVWLSFDHGDSWEYRDFTYPYPRQVSGILSMQYDQFRNKIWAISAIGLCEMSPDDVCDLERDLVLRPVSHIPLQAYPNPFNDQTHIMYETLVPGNVKIEVFDLLGRSVGVLEDQFRQAGQYRTVFSANNLSSGTYFVRLASGDQVRNTRITLVR